MLYLTNGHCICENCGGHYQMTARSQQHRCPHCQRRYYIRCTIAEIEPTEIDIIPLGQGSFSAWISSSEKGGCFLKPLLPDEVAYLRAVIKASGVTAELREWGFYDLDQRLTREWLNLARAAAQRDDRDSLRYCLDNARLYYKQALQSGAY